MTDSRGRHDSMTALGNIPILLHSAEFVHLHGIGLLSMHILSQGSTCCIDEVSSYNRDQPGTYLLMSRCSYNQELTVCEDPIQELNTVTPEVTQVTPSVYGLHVLGSPSEHKPLWYAL
ncbi:hypothetical protein EV421DRAFT_1910809 [Armillaria borealis]|uniref:Uncharacterized protein n=1 Tax=Armillaria borealis TaxID=47425 RepID=A0AA39MF55_9AGAR|nr:hypothetical protein EV421DRAFT_1910809 [Armillaria borealis]